MYINLQGNRDESEVYTEAALLSDAEVLYNKGEKKLYKDSLEFIRILTKKNYQFLRHVFRKYKELASMDIEESIKSEFSGDICTGLLSLGESNPLVIYCILSSSTLILRISQLSGNI